MSLVSIARRHSVLLSPSLNKDANQSAATPDPAALEKRHSSSVSAEPIARINEPAPLHSAPSTGQPSTTSVDFGSVFSFNHDEAVTGVCEHRSTSSNCQNSCKSTGSEEIQCLPDKSSFLALPDRQENADSPSLPSANYYTIKGAAVFLNSQAPNCSAVRPKTPVIKHDYNYSDSFFPTSMVQSLGSSSFTPPASPALTNRSSIPSQQEAEISRHLGMMIDRLRDEDHIMMAARLESTSQNRARYLTLIYLPSTQSSGEQSSSAETNDDLVASALLGFDLTCKPTSTSSTSLAECSEEEKLESDDCESEQVSLGLVVPVLPDMQIRLTGDGGFTTSINDRSYSFKPVAVQVMWACLHSINEAISKAGRSVRSSSSSFSSSSSAWLKSYTESIDSEPNAVSDWQLMDDVISRLPPDSESLIELQIRDQLRTLMSSIDLEEVSSRAIRSSLEAAMGLDLSSYRQFIDEEMLVLLGQLDLPSEIYDYLFLGSEWNASDIRVLARLGITHVVNVSREIDNFFPSRFRYYNVRVFDDESTELLRYWDSVYKFVETARASNGRILVHCKMGVSRSAACVIAYCMKADGKSRNEAIEFVRNRRACVQPNKGFMDQLHVYEGILKASRVRHSDIFKRVEAAQANNGAGIAVSLPISSSKSQGRPVSFHEATPTVVINDPMLLTFPLNSLDSRIAALEAISTQPIVKKSNSHHRHDSSSHTDGHATHHRSHESMQIHERRLRNRTSPALSATLEFPGAPKSHSRSHKTLFMDMSSSSSIKDDLIPLSESDATSTETDAFQLESGHVRRVAAQLLAPNTASSRCVVAKSPEKTSNEARRSSTGITTDAARGSWPICSVDRPELICEK